MLMHHSDRAEFAQSLACNKDVTGVAYQGMAGREKNSCDRVGPGEARAKEYRVGRGQGQNWKFPQTEITNNNLKQLQGYITYY